MSGITEQRYGQLAHATAGAARARAAVAAPAVMWSGSVVLEGPAPSAMPIAANGRKLDTFTARRPQEASP
jgi:hypothetical protein